MKFARYLEQQSVPEWKRAYINYRGLKKLIKRVAARRAARLSLDLSRQGSASSDRSWSAGIRQRNANFRATSAAALVQVQEERDGQIHDASSGDSTGHLIPKAVVGAATALASGVKQKDYGSTSAGGVRSPELEEEDDKLPAVTLKGTGLHLAASAEARHDHSHDAHDDAERAVPATEEEGTEASPSVARPKVAKTHWHPEVQTTGSGRTGADAGGQIEEQAQSMARPGGPQRRPSKHAHRNHSQASLKKQDRDRSKSAASLDELMADFFDVEETKFFLALDAELERIVDFYSSRELDAQNKLEVLASQLKQLAEHRRQYHARQAAQNRTDSDRWRFDGMLPSNLLKITPSVPSSGLFPPAFARDQNTKAAQVDRWNGKKAADQPQDQVAKPSQPEDDEGDRRRSMALAGITRHFAQNQAEDSHIASVSIAAATDPEKYKAARKKLKAAVVEHYRSLEILKNYKILNRTGFVKILKKFEKSIDINCAHLYYDTRVAPTVLVTSDRVESLLHNTEEIFAAYFEHGNKKRARERLRSGAAATAAGEAHSHHFSVFRTGVCLGVAACATIGGLVKALEAGTPVGLPQYQQLLRVYGALFIPTLFALLFGLNLAAWHHVRINALFIFEWDVRTAIDYRQYFELPALFMLLLSLAFWVSFLNPFPSAIAPTTWPLVWIVVISLIMLNPLSIYLASSRQWFNNSMIRVFGGGITHHVEFRDFFLGDELNSLAWSMSTLWVMGCEYRHRWSVPDVCDPNSTLWTAALSSVPAFLRFLQCFRRWKDSDYTARLHLVNAGKYSTVILNNFFYFNYRYHGSHRAADLAIWCLFGTIYSIYTSVWDITMDWSLLRPHARYPLLRNELVFEEVWPLYYFAIVTNVLLRCAWTIYLIPGPASPLTRVFIISLLEMLRRVQWNFLRLENEHLGNVDMYRVSREVPLPYRIVHEDEEYDSSGAQRKRRASGLSWPLETLRKRRKSALAAKLSNGGTPRGPLHGDPEGLDSEERAQDPSSDGDDDTDEESGPAAVLRRLRDRVMPEARDAPERGGARGLQGRDYERSSTHTAAAIAGNGS